MGVVKPRTVLHRLSFMEIKTAFLNCELCQTVRKLSINVLHNIVHQCNYIS